MISTSSNEKPLPTVLMLSVLEHTANKRLLVKFPDLSKIEVAEKLEFSLLMIFTGLSLLVSFLIFPKEILTMNAFEKIG